MDADDIILFILIALIVACLAPIVLWLGILAFSPHHDAYEPTYICAPDNVGVIELTEQLWLGVERDTYEVRMTALEYADHCSPSQPKENE